MARSFDPDSNTFQNTALEILRARDAYMIQSMDAKAEFAGAARDKRITPIGGYYLSRYIEDLDRCMKDIERIGDHLTHIGETSLERFRVAEAILPEDLFRTWFTLFCSAKHVIALMAKSFDPDSNAFQHNALEILRARDAYMIQSMDAKAEFTGAARDKRITPVGGYYVSRYIEDLDRLVRRAKSIAFSERQPDFWVKAAKLEKDVKAAPVYVRQSPVDPARYLELLRKDTPFEDADLPADTRSDIPSESPHQPPPDEPEPAG